MAMSNKDNTLVNTRNMGDEHSMEVSFIKVKKFFHKNKPLNNFFIIYYY